MKHRVEQKDIRQAGSLEREDRTILESGDALPLTQEPSGQRSGDRGASHAEQTVDTGTPPAVSPSVARGRFARHLFNGIADSYHGPARLFSFLQYDRWHRHLVSQLTIPAHSRVLDVCTGTGLVARAIAGKGPHRVVGLDLSDGMLETAQRALAGAGTTERIDLIRGRAEQLPFPDASFDAVVFTYLLRYVEDPLAALQELARVLRPGGPLLSLEFFVPPNPALRALWVLYTRCVMPIGCRLISREWDEVGRFLGPSISQFYKQTNREALEAMWRRAGLRQVRSQTLSLGGAIVMTGYRGT